jgi:hypothetical protein
MNSLLESTPKREADAIRMPEPVTLVVHEGSTASVILGNTVFRVVLNGPAEAGSNLRSKDKRTESTAVKLTPTAELTSRLHPCTGQPTPAGCDIARSFNVA